MRLVRLAVREAILQSALGCEQQGTAECRKLLGGRINVEGARRLILERVNLVTEGLHERGTAQPSLPETADLGAPVGRTSRNFVGSQAQVAAASCGCGGAGPEQYAFAIGQLSYDFGSFAREDSIRQNIGSIEALTPPRKLDARNYLDFLRHLCGFSEIKVEVDSRSLADLTMANNVGNHGGHVQITLPDNFITQEDNLRYVILSGIKQQIFGGPPSAAFLNGAHRIEVVASNPSVFIVSNVEFSGAITYDFTGGFLYIPRQCKVSLAHRPHKHDAKAVIWTLIRGQTVQFAIRPEGSYSELAYEELIDFLLHHLGLSRKSLNFYWYTLDNQQEVFEWTAPWDPCFNDEGCCDRNRASRCCENFLNPASEPALDPGGDQQRAGCDTRGGGRPGAATQRGHPPDH